MAKKLKIDPKVKAQMGEAWDISVHPSSNFKEKGANLPALGYPCASCASKNTKIRFAESSEEEESRLLWMELQCKDCKNFTTYLRKK